MPQLTMIAAALWDLRAQSEQQTRAIIDAQRVLDDYRDSPQSQSRMKSRLQRSLHQVQESHTVIGSALLDYVPLVDALPVSQIIT
jgi:hypothetical protein